MARFLLLLLTVLFYAALAGAIFGVVYAAVRLALAHAFRKHNIVAIPQAVNGPPIAPTIMPPRN